MPASMADGEVVAVVASVGEVDVVAGGVGCPAGVGALLRPTEKAATAPDTAGHPTPPATTSTSPTEATTATTSPSAMLAGIPVYWIADSMRSFSLYREFREVPDTGGPIASAVS